MRAVAAHPLRIFLPFSSFGTACGIYRLGYDEHRIGVGGPTPRLVELDISSRVGAEVILAEADPFARRLPWMVMAS